MINPAVRVVVFCSGSASSLRFLHREDPAFGKAYQVVGVFSDRPDASGLEYAKNFAIPTSMLNYKAWCEINGFSHLNLTDRQGYYHTVLGMIQDWEPDCIILSGFMLLLTEPLLSEYRGRVLNVHPAWLSLQDEAGKRKYTGLNVVARAMVVGDPTGSTVHIVTKEPDMGPIVIESQSLSYQAGDDPDGHQSRMKEACDGPAYMAALKKLIADGWPGVPWSA